MEKSTFFIMGMGTGVLGMFVVAKLLRPTIKEKLANIATDELIRFGQARGVPMQVLGNGVSRDFIKTQLMYPAIEAALTEAYI